MKKVNWFGGNLRMITAELTMRLFSRLSARIHRNWRPNKMSGFPLQALFGRGAVPDLSP
jgi:hypothetical protein